MRRWLNDEAFVVRIASIIESRDKTNEETLTNVTCDLGALARKTLPEGPLTPRRPWEPSQNAGLLSLRLGRRALSGPSDVSGEILTERNSLTSWRPSSLHLHYAAKGWTAVELAHEAELHA